MQIQLNSGSSLFGVRKIVLPFIVAVLGVLNNRAISPKVTGASISLNLHSGGDLTLV